MIVKVEVVMWLTRSVIVLDATGVLRDRLHS